MPHVQQPGVINQPQQQHSGVLGNLFKFLQPFLPQPIAGAATLAESILGGASSGGGQPAPPATNIPVSKPGGGDSSDGSGSGSAAGGGPATTPPDPQGQSAAPQQQVAAAPPPSQGEGQPQQPAPLTPEQQQMMASLPPDMFNMIKQNPQMGAAMSSFWNAAANYQPQSHTPPPSPGQGMG